MADDRSPDAETLIHNAREACRPGQNKRPEPCRSQNRMNSQKTETVYVCYNCGQDFSKWQGKCQNCGAWDTITEFRQPKRGPRAKGAAAKASEAVPLSSCKPCIGRPHAFHVS